MKRFRMLLLGLVLVAVVARVLTLDAPNALPSALSDGITLAASVVIESLPFVFLGVVISIAVQLWVPTRVMDAIVRVVASLGGRCCRCWASCSRCASAGTSRSRAA